MKERKALIVCYRPTKAPVYCLNYNTLVNFLKVRILNLINFYQFALL
jgi:hypothetical protein